MGWGPFQFEITPVQASEHAPRYDLLFGVITLLTIVFTAIVFVMIAVLAVRYKAGNVVDRRNALTHHTGLELLWMGVPTVLALLIFGWSAKQFIDVRSMPKDAMEIFVIGKQWMWHFQHPNGIRENNELHVPVGVPIKMTMISQDVIHSMYLPEMRAQYHVVPGRYTELTFTPTRPGRYKILCAMHCGTQHSEMVGQLYVLSDREWAQWLEKGGNRYRDTPKTMVEEGAQIWKDKACMNCHTGVNNPRAPSLNGLFGQTRIFADGTRTVADRDYIRESIINPHTRITQGYENTMPVYGGQLTEDQVLKLTEYILTLTAGVGAFEAPTVDREVGTNADATPVDIANRGSSAGNMQFRAAEDRR